MFLFIGLRIIFFESSANEMTYRTHRHSFGYDIYMHVQGVESEKNLTQFNWIHMKVGPCLF